MAFPCCNHKVDCGTQGASGFPGTLEFDLPFANLTSETPDRFSYVSINYGYDWDHPSLGSIWFSRFCVGVCESVISQEEADLCAARLSEILCVEYPPGSNGSGGDDGTTGGTGTGGNNPPCCTPPSDPPYPYFYNQQVLASAQCPDGTTFNYVVPAGQFVARSQVLADRMAATYALSQARSARICLGTFTSTCCIGAAYASSMTPTGGVTPLSADVISGSLPPGIFMTMAANARTVILSGTPTATGQYDFILRVSDVLGRYMQKAYRITVSGILNASTLIDGTVGVAYAETLLASLMTLPLTWAVASGSTLPPGLNLNSASGAIFGTPTTAGTYTFTIEVTDGA